METYFSPFPGHYFTGDGATRDEDGFYQITRRMDDVINVTGHRLRECMLMSSPRMNTVRRVQPCWRLSYDLW